MKVALFATAAILLAATAAQATTVPGTPYVGIAGTFGQTYANSGGVNTTGGFPNDGSDDSTFAGVSLTAGLSNLTPVLGVGTLRAELEYNWHNEQQQTTDSLLPFTYDSVVRTQTAFINAYVDLTSLTCPLGTGLVPYLGAGLGVAHHNIRTTDTFVVGADSSNEFAWNVGGGATLPLANGFAVQAGVRYIDLGDTDIALQNIGTLVPAGNHTLSHSAVEGRVGLTYSF